VPVFASNLLKNNIKNKGVRQLTLCFSSFPGQLMFACDVACRLSRGRREAQDISSRAAGVDVSRNVDVFVTSGMRQTTRCNKITEETTTRYFEV